MNYSGKCLRFQYNLCPLSTAVKVKNKPDNCASYQIVIYIMVLWKQRVTAFINKSGIETDSCESRRRFIKCFI